MRWLTRQALSSSSWRAAVHACERRAWRRDGSDPGARRRAIPAGARLVERSEDFIARIAVGPHHPMATTGMVQTPLAEHHRSLPASHGTQPMCRFSTNSHLAGRLRSATCRCPVNTADPGSRGLESERLDDPTSLDVRRTLDLLAGVAATAG